MRNETRSTSVEGGTYATWDGDQLTFAPGVTPLRMAEDVHSALRAVLHDPDYPCVGAKSVVNQNSYRFGLYPRLGDDGTTADLAFDLYRFIQDRQRIEGNFCSFIASFLEPKLKSLKRFEHLLWQQLSALHNLDVNSHSWNAEVSSDPASPNFSFSFGGQAFFIVGLAPPNPRWARCFPWPTLVFNDHFQFERLRAEHRFELLRDTIRKRDSKLHGKANPMVTDFGAHSEAAQYSGRNVHGGWQCPVRFD